MQPEPIKFSHERENDANDVVQTPQVTGRRIKTSDEQLEDKNKTFAINSGNYTRSAPAARRESWALKFTTAIMHVSASVNYSYRRIQSGNARDPRDIHLRARRRWIFLAPRASEKSMGVTRR